MGTTEEWILGESERLRLEGRKSDALRLLGEAIDVSPSSRLYFELGKFLLREGDGQSAVEALERADAMYPGHLPTSFELSKAYLSCGRFSEAIGEIDRILEAAPKHPGARQMKFILAFEMGNYLQAIEIAREFPEIKASKEARVKLAAAAKLIGHVETYDSVKDQLTRPQARDVERIVQQKAM